MKIYLTLMMGLALALQGCTATVDGKAEGEIPFGSKKEPYVQQPVEAQGGEAETGENKCSPRGDFPGCVNAGVAYADTGDYDTARGFFELACAFRDDGGCRLLGLLYEDGLGVEVDYDLARESYEMACDYSGGSNCDRLAGLYLYGRGVDQDFEKAYEINLKACDAKGFASCAGVGIAYEFGKGVGQDYRKAKEYYGRSCDLNFKMGCYHYQRLIKAGY